MSKGKPPIVDEKAIVRLRFFITLMRLGIH